MTMTTTMVGPMEISVCITFGFLFSTPCVLLAVIYFRLQIMYSLCGARLDCTCAATDLFCEWINIRLVLLCLYAFIYLKQKKERKKKKKKNQILSRNIASVFFPSTKIIFFFMAFCLCIHTVPCTFIRIYDLESIVHSTKSMKYRIEDEIEMITNYMYGRSQLFCHLSFDW